ncbi:flagellar hook capping FlgD N-terminal domain-containing protein [Pontibaca methylaminivorans]|uniref:Basal-body rod modification protein FlgD n=1 Tax=Pontibaca methylaminivorans TaxID=515897 RepID=A0A1R3WRH9_9RHOB|nr:flagellar hook capping FlgD N-terminal domain-containing protein [Pontibaca methylaminivorans]SIT80476.1 flagellar basal-body rod modification protein FlgD [Pontibaca methylaminivorans]
MISPDAIANVSNSAYPRGTGTGSDERSDTLSADFETFLKMLTTQARYQDPLKPIDSTEYAAQLAQFSMVEQQLRTNDTLDALVSQMAVANLAALGGWVGMEARSASPVRFDGSPITLFPDPPQLAEEAFLVVRDAQDREVQRVAIPTTGEPVQWAGVDENGEPLPRGTYRFTVESHRGGEVIASDPAETFGRVVEAQIDGGDVYLLLDNGQTVSSHSITALRAPG